MVRRKGNMINVVGQPNSLAIITTNAIVKNNGALVMGAGIAKTVRDSYPGIDRQFGSWIKHNMDSDKVYGFLFNPDEDIAIFQVKKHYADNADLGLIEHSTNMLKAVALEYPDSTFHLNYPGIGNGKLSIGDVQPIIERLPDNVVVWTF